VALSLDWSSTVAKPGDNDRLTVTIPLTGDLDAPWRDAFEERARQLKKRFSRQPLDGSTVVE
jgi:hypothetical protein